jgi:eukaryotic-like serine/threonine-protein kinase
MRLAAGTRFGPYEILAPLGGGGMGEVYRAKDTNLGRDVAIKVLPESFAHDEERMARFEREAQVLASLNHPHIATIHGLEESNGVRALVMELVEGPTLAEQIGGRAMPLDEALPIAKQIAEGLEYAHERGIIHRDLKPANVKLTADGNVKILDFGLAKALDTSPSQGNPSISPTLTLEGTRAGVILGTAAYMAPEQARGATVDKRADIWAYGVVLYEMLTGKQPFAGETVSDTLAGVLKTEPDCGAIPAPLRRLVRRCLDKNPKRRLGDIGEARAVIEDVLSGSADEQPASAAKAGRVSKALRFAPWALSFALLLTTLVISWVHFRQAPPSERVLHASITLPAKAFVNSFALSPDGRYLALAAQAGETRRLFLRPFDAPDPLPLPGTEEARYPFWSPDSRYIAFFTQGKLKKIAVGGGPVQTLCDVPDGRAGTWNREGVIVFSPFGTNGSRLQHVSAGGGVPSAVTRSEGSDIHRFPAFLPDGHRILYLTSSSKTPDQNGISLASLDSKESRRLLPDLSNALYVPPVADSRVAQILFVRNSALMAQPVNPETLQLAGDASPVAEGVGPGPNASFFQFSVSGGGDLMFQAARASTSSQLTWFDRNGGQAGVVGQPGSLAPLESQNVFGNFDISPDGKKVALTRMVSVGQPASDIWLHELERHSESRFTFKGFNFAPVWSPDGSSIAYGHDQAVYQKHTRGTGQEELLVKGDNILVPNSWSPDGRFLILMTLAAGNPDLLVMPLKGDRKPEPFLASEFLETQGKFSPDGKWIAYNSNESGRLEVYVEPFPRRPGAEGKWKVSTDGGENPNWRSDGKELFYLDPGGRLFAVPVQNSGPKSGFAMGTPTVLFDMRLSGDDRRQPGYRVAPDGKRFLVNVIRERGADSALMLVTNWQALLK